MHEEPLCYCYYSTRSSVSLILRHYYNSTPQPPPINHLVPLHKEPRGQESVRQVFPHVHEVAHDALEAAAAQAHQLVVLGGGGGGGGGEGQVW